MLNMRDVKSELPSRRHLREPGLVGREAVLFSRRSGHLPKVRLRTMAFEHP